MKRLTTVVLLVVHNGMPQDGPYSHFYSPVIVAKEVISGMELLRVALEGAVICLEFEGEWLVACEADNETLASGMAEQRALVAINLETGETNRVETQVSVFLPASVGA